MRLLAQALRVLPRRLRHRVVRSMVRFDDSEVADLTVKVADTVGELEAAARLLHDAYAGAHLTDEHASGVRTTPHLVAPTTTTFVAKRRDEVIATMSLILDGPLGLPMDSIYSDEVDALRREGRRVAEVGALCVSRGNRRQGVAVLLNKIMYLCAANLLGIDDLVIAVHPQAAELYEASLLFERMGPERQYPGLNRCARAVALRLALPGLRERWARAFGTAPAAGNMYHQFFASDHPQLRVPTGVDYLLRMRFARVLAGARMVALRPDAFTGLEPATYVYLRRALPTAALPGLTAEVTPVPAPAQRPAHAAGLAARADAGRQKTRTFGFPVADAAA